MLKKNIRIIKSDSISGLQSSATMEAKPPYIKGLQSFQFFSPITSFNLLRKTNKTKYK